MRTSYDSIDNKPKVNKDITFIQFFHSTESFKIFFSLLTLQLLFCKKLVGREKYIEDLRNEKQYSLQKKKGIKFMIKIMLNSLYGVMLTSKEKFRDIRICTNQKQALKYSKMNNIHSFKSIHENLIIVELSKVKVTYDTCILVDSQILMNSKCDLYEYMYKILPKLFKKQYIRYCFRDTDSIAFKIDNCTYKQY